MEWWNKVQAMSEMFQVIILSSMICFICIFLFVILIPKGTIGPEASVKIKFFICFTFDWGQANYYS